MRLSDPAIRKKKKKIKRELQVVIARYKRVNGKNVTTAIWEWLKDI